MQSAVIRRIGKDGNVFVGGVNSNNERHGMGCISDKSGFQRFVGNFENDVPTGQCGQCVYSNNTVYAGCLVEGKREGMGRLHRLGVETVFGPMIYDGSWADDLPDGRGIFSAHDGVYEGEWRRGKRHGKGRFLYKVSGRELPVLQPGLGWLAVLEQVEKATEDTGESTRLFEGNWENDQPHGIGRYCGYTLKFDRGRIVHESVKSYNSSHHSGRRIKAKVKSGSHKVKTKLISPGRFSCVGTPDQAIDVVAVMQAGAVNASAENPLSPHSTASSTPSPRSHKKNAHHDQLANIPDATVISAPFHAVEEIDTPWNRALFRVSS